MASLHVLIARSALHDQMLLALDEIESILSATPFINIAVSMAKKSIPTDISLSMATELSKISPAEHSKETLLKAVEDLQRILVPQIPLPKSWQEYVKLSQTDLDLLFTFLDTIVELANNYIEKLNEH